MIIQISKLVLFGWLLTFILIYFTACGTKKESKDLEIDGKISCTYDAFCPVGYQCVEVEVKNEFKKICVCANSNCER